MPVTRKFGPSGTLNAGGPSQPQAGPFDTLRRWLGTGTRVATGVASSVLAAEPGLGTLGGGLLSGAGESAAEFIEGSNQNPSRIAVEAGLGMVPFGKWIGAARGAKGAAAIGRDVLAGGAAAGLGEAGREWAEGEDLNPWAIGGTTAVGGVLGGGGGEIARRLSAPSASTELPVISPTQRTSVKTKGGPATVEHATPPTEGARRFGNRPQYDEFKKVQGYKPEAEQLGMLGRDNEVVEWGAKGKPLRTVIGQQGRDIKPSDGNAMHGFAEDINEAAKGSFKVVDALAKRRQQDTLSAMDRGITDSDQVTTLGRQKRLGYEADVNKFDEALTRKYGRTTPSAPVPPQPQSHGDYSKLPRRPVGGGMDEEADPYAALREVIDPEAYRGWGRYGNAPDEQLTKLMDDSNLDLPGGEIVTDPIARLMNATVDNPAYQKNFPKGRGVKTSKFDEAAGITDGAWVEEGLEDVNRRSPIPADIWQQALDALRGAGKKAPKGGKPNLKGEKGAAPTEVAGAIAGGLGGGLYGATEDEGPYDAGWKNRGRNAALYGLMGAGAGYAIPRAYRAQQEGNLGEVAEKAAAGLPNWQRFNYLLSLPKMGGATGMDVMPGAGEFNVNPGGLAANAVVGPAGSVVSGGLEASLASAIGRTGDKKGGRALRELPSFLREMKESVPEAIRRIREGEEGRADYAAMGNSPFQNMTAAPGVAMTTGDVAGGRILERSGFGEKEIRDIMLTGEGEHPMIRQGQSWGKGTKLGEFLFPFRRTPFNSLEQGVRRLPGVGLAAQNWMRDTPDAWNEQLAQQVLGAGYMGAGYLAGDNVDPDTAKWLRRYVTNASGRYGMGAGLGFAMGQAHNRNEDKGGNWFDQSLPGLFQLQTVDSIMPLPTIEPVMDYAQMAKQAVDSEPHNVKPPRGSMPPELYDLLFPPTKKRVTRRF